MLYAKFTPDGIPSHIVNDPRDGYEPLPDGMSIMDAAAHMRAPDGTWHKRPPPPEPSPEAVEAQRVAQIEAAYQAALVERETAIDAAITASEAYRSFIRGGMTLTAYRDAAAEIAARFPMPERSA